nr:hypothetical protein CFP56_04437 [Quercus suber]
MTAAYSEYRQAEGRDLQSISENGRLSTTHFCRGRSLGLRNWGGIQAYFNATARHGCQVALLLLRMIFDIAMYTGANLAASVGISHMQDGFRVHRDASGR